jgi:integrase
MRIVRSILAATLTPPSGSHPKAAAAWRWMPWIAAYTGAEFGEIVRLRGSDVSDSEGIWVLRFAQQSSITHRRRLVPLHPHLIEQGFLEFARSQAEEHLFLDDGDDPAKVVAKIGALTRKVAGNTASQAWRRRFVSQSCLAGTSIELTNEIHGRSFRASKLRHELPDNYWLKRMQEEIAKLPQIEVGPAHL